MKKILKLSIIFSKESLLPLLGNRFDMLSNQEII